MAFAALVVACGSANPPQEGPGMGPPSTATAEGGALECAPGRAGCPCTTPGESVACGTIVDRAGSYVTCSMGTSVCTNGTWATCAGKQTLVTKSLSSTSLGGDSLHFESLPTPCGTANLCDPNPSCTQVTGVPSTDVDAAGVYVAPDGGITLQPPDGSTTAPTCQGLQCDVVACAGDGGLTTTIQGTVTDPAGANPLYGVTVYIPVDPTGTLPGFTEGAGCNTCSGATPINAVSVTTTGTDGTFTLTNVPSGTGIPSGAGIPIVVQSGKWRREIMLKSVQSCVANSVSANCTAPNQNLCTLRLPQSGTDGYNAATGLYNYADLPHIAMVSGSADPLECILVKAGISLTEISSYERDLGSNAGNHHIHFYQSPNAPGTSLDPAYGSVQTGSVLWLDSTDPATETAPFAPPHYDFYDVVLDACEGSSIDKEPLHTHAAGSGEPYKNLIHYADVGGRAFLTHYSYVWVEYPSITGNPFGASPYVPAPDNWNGIANWVSRTGTTDTQDPLQATINQTFAKGAAFASWAQWVGASLPAAPAAPSGLLQIHQAREDLAGLGTAGVPTPGQYWMTATNSNPPHGQTGQFDPHFTFNTPYSASTAQQCGRVVYSDFHVTADALVGGGNPTCHENSECGFGQTCTGMQGTAGTCSEPCATSSDCADSTYTCVGATAGTCQPTSCNAGTPSWACPTGVCNAAHTACQCTSNSQCQSGFCVSLLNSATSMCTATCAGTGPSTAFATNCCSGQGTMDPNGCQTDGYQACTLTTTYSCGNTSLSPAPTTNSGNPPTACLCTADTDCNSGKCVPNNPTQCTGACTGSGTKDAANCEQIVSTQATPVTCGATSTPNSADTVCLCVADTDCPSGKCVPNNPTQCTGACTGSGTHDSANCQQLLPAQATPITCGATSTPNSTGTACLCIANSDCASGKCVMVTSGTNANNASGQCTAGACTGVAATGMDAANCQKLPTVGTAVEGCAKGGCNAAGGSCSAAGLKCFCISDSQCPTGASGTAAKCAYVTTGANANSLGCGSASTCTGSAAAALDDFDCVLAANGIPATPTPVYTCPLGETGTSGACESAGATATCTATTPCWCTSNSQCASHVCKTWTGCTGTCTASAAATDDYNCVLADPGIPATPTPAYACPMGETGGTGACESAGSPATCTTSTPCWCTGNSQCVSGQCKTWTGCTGTCTTTAAAVDDYNCVLVSPGIPATPTAVYTCPSGETGGAGGCESGGATATCSTGTPCWCTSNSQCLSGQCAQWGGCTGTCTASGPAVDGYNCIIASPGLPAPTAVYSCPSGETGGAGACESSGAAATCSASTPCWCASNTQCPSGQCKSWTGCTGTCTSTAAATDDYNCVLVANGIPAASTALGTTFQYTPSNFTATSYTAHVPGSATTISAACAYTSFTTLAGTTTTSTANATVTFSVAQSLTAGATLWYNGTALGTVKTTTTSSTSATLNANAAATESAVSGAGITNWTCAGTAPYIAPNVTQTGGPNVDILVFSSLTLSSTLTLTGGNPVIFAIYGNATISGTINANGSAGGSTGNSTQGAAGTNGAGGNWSCGTSTGGSATDNRGGGGGGGMAVAGGAGGTPATAGAAGTARAGASNAGTPLVGGCPGGTNGSECPQGIGGAGGAVQISAAGTVTLTGGTINTSGGNGTAGKQESNTCACGGGCNGSWTGGSGGGSAGDIVVEGYLVTGGTLTATGGTGGANGNGGAGGAGGTATLDAVAGSAPTAGANGGNNGGGGGGGGGSGGFVHIGQHGCTTTLSPAPVPASGGGAVACLCVADSNCASGKCVNANSQCTAENNGTGSSLCTGSGATYDAADCQVIDATLSGSYACSSSLSPAPVDEGNTACLCAADGECNSGKCVMVTSGANANSTSGKCTAGTCTGSGSADAQNCMIREPTAPSSYTCGSTSTPSGTTACLCVADTDCSSGKCVPNTPTSQCTGSCTGAGTHDAANCQLIEPTTASSYSCPSALNFGYTPSNFAATSYISDIPSSGTTVNCNMTYTSPGTAGASTWCGGTGPYIIPGVGQTGGPAVDILVFQSLTVASGSTLTLAGTNAVIFAVYGNATVAGTISANGGAGASNSQNAGTSGPGGNYSCTTSAGGAGNNTGSNNTGGGGGGASGAGGTGGNDNSGHAGGTAGAARANASLVPLYGGCPGGKSGGCGQYASGGGGGGAVQISAAGALSVTGSITANGGSGGNGLTGTGCGGTGASGGGGGGSGGAILLQSSSGSATGATVNGGAGGLTRTLAGGSGGTSGTPTGGNGTTDNGGGGGDGGSGGGGGYGYQTTNLTEAVGGAMPVASGSTACLCTADSDCASGKCVNANTQCTGTCTGSATATHDAADCQQLVPGQSSFTCTTTLTPAPVSNTGGTACLCTSNTDCGNGQCVMVTSGANANNASGQCTAGTCTGTAAYDAANCQASLVSTSTGATSYSCPMGESGAAGACESGGNLAGTCTATTPCWCTSNAQCTSNECLHWNACAGGTGTGSTQCVASLGTTNGVANVADDYNCVLVAPGIPTTPTAATYSCPLGETGTSGACENNGATATCTPTTPCWCTSNAQCTSGECLTWNGCGGGTGTASTQCVGSLGSTNGVANVADDYNCVLVSPGIPTAPTAATYACPAGENGTKGNCDNVVSSSGTCAAAGTPCFCTSNSQCLSGVCNNWSGCAPGACTQTNGVVDDYGCLLAAPGIPATPASSTMSSGCSSGTCNASSHCQCTADNQCGNGLCIPWAGCSANACNGNPGGVADDFGCQDPSAIPPASCTETIPGSCSVGNPSGVGSSCVCQCTADNQCPSGQCVNVANQCTTGPCSGTGNTYDAAYCVPANITNCTSNAQCGGISGTSIEACSGAGDSGNPGLGQCQCSASTHLAGGLVCCTGPGAPNAACTAAGEVVGCSSNSQCKDNAHAATCTGAAGAVNGHCCNPTLPPTNYTVNPSSCGLNAKLFPEACLDAPMSAQEQALEFMFFDLTSCVTPDTGTAPPPPLKCESFTLDFTSSCPSGSQTRWRELDYSATFPASDAGASISISAQTGPENADGGAGDAGALVPTPSLALVNSEQTTGSYKLLLDTAGGYQDAGAVAGFFSAAMPPLASQPWLRLAVTMCPTTDETMSPTLNTWSVIYDCPSSE